MREIVNPKSGIVDKVVNSVAELDLSDLKCPMIAIYRCPLDYPEEYVARIFDLDKPTNTIMIASCFWLLQFDIEKHTHMKFHERSSGDEEHIVGTYF